ncbi:NB-ARC domain, LRR domain containing protein, partial [Parasponia andersonii]
DLVAGAFLSAFLQVLFDRLASREVLDLFRGKEPIVKLLNELNTTLNSAGLLLHDAEAKLIKDQRVKKWLDELKETVYDADDLVYKINTEALRKELEGESQSSFTSKVLMKLIPTSFIAFDKAIKPEIDDILGKLKVLLEPKNIPGLQFIENKKLPQRLPASRVKESDIYGRDADKEAIIELLFSDDASGDKLFVIPIVGMGGIGKTTLAQLVYNDERVNNRFDTKAWVTVGDDKIDCMKVMKIILEQVTNSRGCKIEEQYVLQDKLEKALIGKKFLFVIDDVWDEDPQKWDVLKNSVASGLRGSKIIVTTRNQDVALIMKPGSIHYLDGVSNEDGWLLFAKHALLDVDSKECSDLQEIGENIVHKCKGLPLAIKSLGGLLPHERNKEKWIDILNSEIWELYERRSTRILPALWLSYYYLPSHLKPCFAYCALFPKDYKFKKEKIILLWMAEGYLHSTTKKRMEEVGEEYFQDLISRSFFQPSSKGQSDLLTMHDLLHDLAIFVSGEFCLKMDDSNFSNCARKIRHLSYNGGIDDDPNTYEWFSKAKGLRTFLTLSESKPSKEWSLWMEHLLESLLRTGGCLRVLSIFGCNITKLPNSIGDLKYLRYVDLSHTKIEQMPDAICNLFNLQTLLLEGCDRLTRLPTNIGKLINLRHLHTPPNLEEMPLQIGKMKNLQTLNEFVVSKSNQSYIKLLKQLQYLHGTLYIKGLENVVDVEDVVEAELKNKKFLSELEVHWDWGDDSHAPDNSQKEREVLGALEPPAKLKRLFIRNYEGTSFPNWVGDHLYSNLVEVWLIGSNNCCLLPPLGQLSSLKKLVILGFSNVARISSEFYCSSTVDSPSGAKPFRSLETLCFENMENLQGWSFIEGEVEGGVFPRLKELEFRDCPRFKVSLPDYLPSLRKLEIFKCDQLVPLLPRAQQMDASFPSLEILEITFCRGQHLLLEGGLPSSFKQIRISYCDNLKALDEETFQRLTSLEKLEIWQCDKLRCLPRGLPTSLSYLTVKGCRLLIPRLKRETGEDWPIIARIPTTKTNDECHLM